MSATATHQTVDMVRLAALIARLSPQENGVCHVEGCVHEYHPVAGAHADREPALAA